MPNPTDPTPDERLSDADLDSIEQRLKAAAIERVVMDEHRDGLCRCPLCDGDGEVETDTFDTDGPGYVGIQAFGVGKRLAAVNQFVAYLPDDMPKLIAELRHVRRQLAEQAAAWRREAESLNREHRIADGAVAGRLIRAASELTAIHAGPARGEWIANSGSRGCVAYLLATARRCAALEAEVEGLAAKWERQQATYPDDENASYAAAAVRLCAKELRQIKERP